MPGTSGAPGGGGYFPSRCIRSGRLTPAASTRISTSPAPIAGIALVTGFSTSGPPGVLISITVIDCGRSATFTGSAS